MLALKKELPSLRLLIAVPCKTQARLWPQAQQKRYAEVLAAADEVRVLSGAYYRGCMLVRNRYMVDRSSVCICYLTQMKGGTMYTATYAAKEDLRLINIALTDENKPLEPFRKSDKYLSDRLD